MCYQKKCDTILLFQRSIWSFGLWTIYLKYFSLCRSATEPQPFPRKKGLHFATLVKTLKTQGLTSNLLSSLDLKKNHNCHILLISLKPSSVIKDRLFTVPYFSLRSTGHQGVLPLMAAIWIFKFTGGAGVVDYTSLSSFDTHAIWQSNAKRLISTILRENRGL